MKIILIEQRTPDWYPWRNNGVGGSEVPVIVAYARLLLADAKKRGHAIAEGADRILAAFAPLGLSSVYDATPRKVWAGKKGLYAKNLDRNPNVIRGRRWEDAIRGHFEAKTGLHVIAGECLEHDRFPHFRVSLDGRLLDGTPLELKAHNETVMARVKTEGIPKYYYPQVVYQAAVAGAHRGLFYGAQVNEQTGALIDDHMEEVPLDPEFVRGMLLLVDYFWQTYVLGDEEPPLVDGLDIVSMDDHDAWKASSDLLRAADATVKALEAKLAAAKKAKKAHEADLVALLGDHAKAAGNGVQVSRFFKRGNVDYAAALAKLAPEVTPAHLEDFRKAGKDDTCVTIKPVVPQPAANEVTAVAAA